MVGLGSVTRVAERSDRLRYSEAVLYEIGIVSRPMTTTATTTAVVTKGRCLKKRMADMKTPSLSPNFSPGFSPVRGRSLKE